MAIPWPTILALLRVSTHPRALERQLGIELAWTRAELARLVDAVQARLHPEASTEEHRLLVGTLRGDALRFEADHPVLGESIRRAIDTLSSAGI
ncbi:MAG: DUF4404 family protein [Candidatus Rokubacteria bacterium]|nr:DUF4404 family protein [Candidatus Rokubacteria bacterium]